MKIINKLSKDVIIPDFKYPINKDISLSRIKYLVEANIDYDVYLSTKKCNLQRPFVWTLLQKQQLILSILKEINIPKICVVEYNPTSNDKDKIYQIIDGKQRLNAILEFYKGIFPINVNNVDYYYDNLDNNLQMRIFTFSPRADIAYSYNDSFITDDEKIAWFELVNFAGTQIDIEHINKIKSK